MGDGDREQHSSDERYRGYLKAELEAAAVYRAMAEIEKDSSRAAVFGRLVEAEMRHASRWAEKLGMDVAKLEPAGVDVKLRLFRLAARVLGTGRMVPWLVRGEVKELEAYASDPEARDLVVEERSHARVLKELTFRREPVDGLTERRHLFGGGGSLRAAVLELTMGWCPTLAW